MPINEVAILFLDESPKSKLAKSLVEESGMSFEIVTQEDGVTFEDDFFLPAIQGIYGDFRGVRAVQRYIALWKADLTRRA